MMFLYLLSWVAMIIQICFITLAIAAGLYYLAELVEEYTVTAGRVIKWLIVATILVYVGLLIFEEMPYSLILMGFVTSGAYLTMLRTFPFIELSSPLFLITTVLVIYHHYLAFNYFATVWYQFSEILAFFTICLWLVPFAFFVSLSANENILPTTVAQQQRPSDEADVVSSYFTLNKKKRYNLMAFLRSAQESILPQRVKKSY